MRTALTALAVPMLLAACTRRGDATPVPPRAAEAPCAAEENCGCPVPGIPERWALAACMAAEQTDDEQHPGVQECFHRATAAPGVRELSPCAQNARFKRQACAAQARTAGGVEACVQDSGFFPYPVLRGVGG